MHINSHFQALVLGLFTIIMFNTCKITQKKRPVTSPPGFDWQGHRGCRGLMPENSIPAFLKALEFEEVTTLELDLAVSKDGQLIVSHEPWFNPSICQLPNGDSILSKNVEKYLIYGLTRAQVQEFDCGSKGNSRFPEQMKQKTYKPTLREVVEAVNAKGKSIKWNIEIKSQPDWDGIKTPPINDFCKIVLQELKALGIEKTSTVQSFDVRAVKAVHDLMPEVTTALLIENLDGFEKNLDKLGFSPSIYSPYYMLVNRDLVKKCKQKGIKLIPWTVNDVLSMRRLIRLGVDGIITDYPDKIRLVSQK